MSIKLFVGGEDITQLVASVSTSGAHAECARTLSAEILQPVGEINIPVVALTEGKPVVFDGDGQYFVGVLVSASRSTSASTVSITAKDMGTYIKRNKIVSKIKNATPDQAAATLCAAAGIPVGDLAKASGIISRNFINVTLYDAIMTAYTLGGEKDRNYRIIMDGTNLCVEVCGEDVVGAIRPKANSIDAAYSVDVSQIVTAVDIYNSDGKLIQTVSGDISGMGEVHSVVVMSSDKDDAVASANELLKSGKIKRKATVQCLGDPNFVTGAAVFVEDTHTGLYGKFYIESDTHTWKNGIYITKLSLEWENTMDAKKAGTEIAASKSKKKSKGSSGNTKDIVMVSPTGEVY